MSFQRCATYPRTRDRATPTCRDGTSIPTITTANSSCTEAARATETDSRARNLAARDVMPSSQLVRQISTFLIYRTLHGYSTTGKIIEGRHIIYFSVLNWGDFHTLLQLWIKGQSEGMMITFRHKKESNIFIPIFIPFRHKNTSQRKKLLSSDFGQEFPLDMNKSCTFKSYILFDSNPFIRTLYLSLDEIWVVYLCTSFELNQSQVMHVVVQDFKINRALPY